MVRNASVAETDISKKTTNSADHQEHAPKQEQHIAYATGGQPHPSQAARNASTDEVLDTQVSLTSRVFLHNRRCKPVSTKLPHKTHERLIRAHLLIFELLSHSQYAANLAYFPWRGPVS